MGWGTVYKHEGYLNRIYKSQISSRKEDCIDNIKDIWNTILAYMVATPPAYAQGDDNYEYPYAEFMASKVKELREALEEEMYILHQINDCEEAMENDPESVVDD